MASVLFFRPTSRRLVRRVCWFMVTALQVTTAVKRPIFSSADCPHWPAGRLEDGAAFCPVPGRLGILADSDDEGIFPWTYTPSCISPVSLGEDVPRLDCVFSSAEFRNGLGTSIVSSPATVSHLLGIGALFDKPTPCPSLRQRPWGPAYEMVPTRGRGQGVVASRKISRGEIIMADVPALLIGTGFLADAKPHHRRRILKQAINQLPEETKNKVLSLSRSPSNYEVDAILAPNSHTVSISDDEVHVGLFTEVAVRFPFTYPARQPRERRPVRCG